MMLAAKLKMRFGKHSVVHERYAAVSSETEMILRNKTDAFFAGVVVGIYLGMLALALALGGTL